MGMEMMINALLKCMGYSKEDFENVFSEVKNEYHAAKQRSIAMEQRLSAIESDQKRILELLEKIVQQTPASN